MLRKTENKIFKIQIFKTMNISIKSENWFQSKNIKL